MAQGGRVRIWLWLAVVAGGAVNPANPQVESEGVAFVMPNDVHEKLILGFDYKSKKMSIRLMIRAPGRDRQTNRQLAKNLYVYVD